METEEIQEEIVEVAPEVIERAKGMGWIPEEEFKGAKDRWRPADEYVQRADEMLPIMKSQMGKYETQITTQSGKIVELEKTIADQKKTTEKIIKMSEKVGQQEYERAKKDLTQKQVQAVSDGDVDTWQKLEDKKDELEKPEPIVTEEKVETKPTTEAPEFKEWHADNDWYLKDNDLTMFANAYGESLKQTSPGMPYAQWLESIKSKVESTFPDKFTNPSRDVTSLVDSPSQRGGDPGTGKKTYSDLPADAKAQCDILVKDEGCFTVKTREDYVKSFFEEE